MRGGHLLLAPPEPWGWPRAPCAWFLGAGREKQSCRASRPKPTKFTPKRLAGRLRRHPAGLGARSREKPPGMRLHVFSTAPKHGVLHPKAALPAAALTCHPPGTPKATPSPRLWGTTSRVWVDFSPIPRFPQRKSSLPHAEPSAPSAWLGLCWPGEIQEGENPLKSSNWGKTQWCLWEIGAERGFRAAGTHRAAPVLPQHPGAAFWARIPRSADFLLPALPHGAAGRRAPRVRDIWGSAPVPAPRWVPRSGTRPAPPCLSFPSAGDERLAWGGRGDFRGGRAEPRSPRRDPRSLQGVRPGRQRLHLQAGAGHGHALAGLHAQRGGARGHHPAPRHGR